MLEEGRGDASKVVTVNNGVNPAIFRKMAVTPDAAAKYTAQRRETPPHRYPSLSVQGVDRVLESLPAISRAVPGVKYLIVGAGPDRPRLEDLAVRLGVQNQVRFLGTLPLSEIVELYNVADLFLMLSREDPPDVEGFGLVFLEAAACGLPSVGGRSGGIPDAIEEGKSGWLVDPRDTQAIAATLIDLLSSREKLQRASEYCLATAPQKSWEQVADKVFGEMFD